MGLNGMNKFSDFHALTVSLSEKIALQLAVAIKKNGHALLAVSGGHSPKAVFEALSIIDIQWQKVWVVLVDERWLDSTHADSNELLVRQSLLRNKAKMAKFMPLKSTAISAQQAQEFCNAELQNLPSVIDVLLLGMGDDGHTASFFPCANEQCLTKILDKQNSLRAMAIQPNQAPYERMSLTAAYLLKSQCTYLLLKGDKKLRTYNKALNNDDVMAMPIRLFMNNTSGNMEVFYAAN